MSQKFKSEVELQALNNATTDTDKFLVSDSGVVKYRTGNEVLSDLGITLNTASKLQHQVKAGVAINKGQAVYVTSADGTNMIVGLASNASEATSSKTMGLLDATVAINGFANVVTEGLLDGLNTVGANAGDPVWLGTGGNLIYGLLNKPYAPAHLVFIGIVTRVNANNGEIFVKVQNGFELNEIHDVDLKTTTPVNGHVLGFDGTLWVNKTIAGWLGYTPANANGTTNYVSKFTSATTLGNSQIFDNGSGVGIGTSSPSQKLHVVGNIIADDLTLGGNESTPTINFTSGGSARASLDYNNSNGVITLENKYGLFAIKTGSGGSSSERMRITSSGNVGIGTTSPLSLSGTNLSIVSAGNVRLQLDSTNDYRIISNTSGDFSIQDSTNSSDKLTITGTGEVRFRNNSAETMRITSGGNVGIGTTSPGARLDVRAQGALSTDIAFRVRNSADTSNLIEVNGAGGIDIRCTPSNRLTLSNTVETNFDIVDTGGHSKRFFVRNSDKTLAIYNNDTGQQRTQFRLVTGTGASNDRLSLLEAGGNVGIGTSSPSSKLTVVSSTNTILKLKGGTSNNQGSAFYIERANSTSTLFAIGDSSSITGGTPDLLSTVFSSTQLNFYINGSERMRIASNGKVGIGTSSPASLLAVGGSGEPAAFSVSGISGINTITTFRDIDGENVFLTAGKISDSSIDIAFGDVNSSYGLPYYRINSTRHSFMDGNVGIGTETPDPSAILDLESKTQGFLPPRMTVSRMNSIVSPATGLIIFDIDSGYLRVFDGTEWKKIAYI